MVGNLPRLRCQTDIVSVRDPLGHITRTPFDANGHPKGSEDALGRSTSTVYDARGNLTQIIDASGAKTQLRYNALDLPVLLTDALGGVWTREYDDRGQLTASTDPLGQRTRYAYDEQGNGTRRRSTYRRAVGKYWVMVGLVHCKMPRTKTKPQVAPCLPGRSRRSRPKKRPRSQDATPKIFASSSRANSKPQMTQCCAGLRMRAR
jgi:YD repeat-containing protein